MYEYVWSSGTPPAPRHHAYDYDPPQLTIAQMTLAAMYNVYVAESGFFLSGFGADLILTLYSPLIQLLK